MATPSKAAWKWNADDNTEIYYKDLGTTSLSNQPQLASSFDMEKLRQMSNQGSHIRSELWDAISNYYKAFSRTTILEHPTNKKWSADDESAFECIVERAKEPTFHKYTHSGNRCQRSMKCVSPLIQRYGHLYTCTESFIFTGIQGANIIPAWSKFVPHDGYCWLTIIYSLSFYVLPVQEEIYIERMKDLINKCGRQPSLYHFIKLMVSATFDMPYLWLAPLPPIWINHRKNILHVSDQRGAPEDCHQLEIDCLKDFFYGVSIAKNTQVATWLLGAHQDEEMSERMAEGRPTSHDVVDRITENILAKISYLLEHKLSSAFEVQMMMHKRISLMDMYELKGEQVRICDELKKSVSLWIKDTYIRQDELEKEGFGSLRNVPTRGKQITWKASPHYLQTPEEIMNMGNEQFRSPFESFANQPAGKLATGATTAIQYLKRVNNAYSPGGSSGQTSIPMVKDLVPKEGFCYMSVFLALGQQVLLNDCSLYTSLVDVLRATLGAWPTFERVVKAFYAILVKFPYLDTATIPTMVINKDHQIIHFCDQRGQPTNTTVVLVDSLGDIIDLLQYSDQSWFQFKVGASMSSEINYVGTEESIKDFLGKEVNGKDKDKSWAQIFKEEVSREESERKARMWMLLKSHYEQDLLESFPVRRTMSVQQIDVGPFDMMKFYQDNIKKIRESWKRWFRDGTLIHELARDPELATFLLFSPAVMSKLVRAIQSSQAKFDSINAILENNANAIHLSHLLKCMIKGFGNTLSERIVSLLHLKARELIENSTLDTREMDLIKKISKEHASFCSSNFFIVSSLERSLHEKNIKQFLDIGSTSEWCSFVYHLAWPDITGGYGRGKWDGSQGTVGNSLKKLADKVLVPQRLIRFPIKFINSFITMFTIVFNLAAYAWGFCSVLQLSLFFGKIAIQRFVKVPNQATMLLFVMTVLGAILYMNRSLFSTINKKKEFQAKREEPPKALMSFMAFAILITYIFSVDTANMLSAAFNHFSRLAAALIDTNIIGGGKEFQADFLDVELEITEQEEGEGLIKRVKDTFGTWRLSKHMEGIDNTRPLEYGAEYGNQYVIQADAASDVAAQALNTTKDWNFVLGATGSGKSTIFPVAYYNLLKQQTKRKHRILILQPTRAATRNVAGGIESHFGQAIYVKHQDYLQHGHMGIQVMTYGSALYTHMANANFLDQFDTVFLDESHLISEHSLVFESVLNLRTNIVKFYVTATPRVAKVKIDPARRFPINKLTFDGKDPQAWLRNVATGCMEDPFNYGKTVLVFVTGRRETETLAAALVNKQPQVKTHAVHSDNFKEVINKVEADLSAREKKVVVFCTNIFETGVTMDVDVVVDFGFTMKPVLDLTEKTLILEKKRITANQREQRIGRCGRIKNGTALCFGKVVPNDQAVDANTVYSAAILSYVLDVDIYVNSHLSAYWLENITREQATLMAALQLPLFLTRDLIDKEGRVHRSVAKFLSKFANESMSINVHSNCVTSESYNSWPRLEEIAIRTYRGEIPEEIQKISKERVPFACQSVEMEVYMKMVEVLKEVKPTAQRLLKNKGEITRKITLDLREPALQQTLSYVQELLTTYTNALCGYSELERKLNFGLFANKLNCFQAKKNVKIQIEKIQRNLDKVTRLRSRIEEMIGMQEGEHDFDYYDNYEIKKCLEFQSDQVLTKEKVVELCELEQVETASITRAIVEGDLKVALAGLFCLTFALAGFLVYQCVQRIPKVGQWISSGFGKNTVEDFVKEFEAAKKKRISTRDKRNPAMMYSEQCEDVMDTYFGENTEEKLKVRKKKSYDNAYITHLTKEKLPWYIFYDISNDDAVDYAILKNDVGKELFRTERPIADIEKATLATEEDLNAPLAHALWSDECHDYFYEIHMKNGRTYKVHMTPHNPSKYTGHGNVAGFPEKNNILRQTGPTKILECSTEVPHSKANPDVPQMVGLIFEEGAPNHCLHAIIYNHWLIIPGHIMTTVGSDFKLKFQGSFFDFNIKQVVHIPGMDMILVPKPPSIKMTKLAARARVLTVPEEITFFYFSKQMKKFVQSGSRRALKDDREGKWSHTISTARGMCGAPVISMNTGHMVGIHVVGDTISRLNTFQAFNEEILQILEGRDYSVVRSRILAKPSDLGFRNEDFENFQIRRVTHIQQPNELTDEACFEESLRSGEASEAITVRVEENAKSSFEMWILRDGFVTRKEVKKKAGIPEGFSRDLSIYTREALEKWAVGNMNLQIKAITEDIEPTTKLNMPVVASMAPKILEKHRKLCESDHWLEFKELHPELTNDLQDFEWAYLPSKLNKQAYWKDLSKYDHPCIATPKPEQLKVAAEWVVNHLKANGMGTTRVASTDQVLEDLQWQTAAGSVYFGAKGKVLEVYTEEQIRSLTNWCKKGLLEGKNAGIWNASLKAELRPKEKVEANKTRVFTAAPLTTLLATKHFVDDFNKQFYSTHLRANHTVGINKFRRGWEKLFEKLNRPGYYWGGGDGSRYDSSIEPFFFDMMVWIRMQFVSDDDKEDFQKALWHMYREFVYTPIYCVDGKVVVKRLGQPSGQPSTVVDNTIILMVSFVYALIGKLGKNEAIRVLDNEMFNFVCNGDDNKFTVHPSLVCDNKFDLSEQFNELGLDYKFEDLTRDPYEHYYMSLRFLKTTEGIGFTLEDERLIAILQWKRGKRYIDVLQSIQAACVESYNRSSIFKVAYTYLRWFLYQYHREIAQEEMEEGGKLRILTETEIHNLHYQPEGEVIEEINTQHASKEFQMDIGEERRLQSSEEMSAMADPPTGPVSRTPPGSNIIGPTAAGEATTWNLGTLSTEQIELAMIPSLSGTPVIDESTLKSIPYHQMHFDNTTATEDQVKAWETFCKQKYGGTGQALSDSHFNKLKVAFIYWCADNGTSENHDFDAKTKIPTGPNTSMELPLRPFLEGSKSVGLRKIMRFYSDLTVLLLKKRGTLTRWAIKRGICQKEMIPFAFDFLKFDHKVTAVVREILTQAKAGALGSGTKRAMLTDGNVSQGTSYERHTTRDVSEYEHGPSGTGHAMIM
nr:polyprotein [Areca palm necrotic ringspot virus]